MLEESVKEQEENEQQESIKEIILEYVKVIVSTLAVTFILLQFVQVSKVVGSSMENTYFEGNILLVDKFFYKKGEPERNDIVIVDYDNGYEEVMIIKRVVAVGGDTIAIVNNEVFVNGEAIEEDYVKDSMLTNDLYLEVPEGKVFVMGDNRNHSLDSRSIGCFDFDDDVIGKVFFKVPLF